MHFWPTLSRPAAPDRQRRGEYAPARGADNAGIRRLAPARGPAGRAHRGRQRPRRLVARSSAIGQPICSCLSNTVSSCVAKLSGRYCPCMRITHSRSQRERRAGSSARTLPAFLLAVAAWLMLLLVALVALAGRTGLSGGLVAVGVLLAASWALVSGIHRWLDATMIVAERVRHDAVAAPRPQPRRLTALRGREALCQLFAHTVRCDRVGISAAFPQ